MNLIDEIEKLLIDKNVLHIFVGHKLKHLIYKKLFPFGIKIETALISKLLVVSEKDLITLEENEFLIHYKNK